MNIKSIVVVFLRQIYKIFRTTRASSFSVVVNFVKSIPLRIWFIAIISFHEDEVFETQDCLFFDKPRTTRFLIRGPSLPRQGIGTANGSLEGVFTSRRERSRSASAVAIIGGICGVEWWSHVPTQLPSYDLFPGTRLVAIGNRSLTISARYYYSH